LISVFGSCAWVIEILYPYPYPYPYRIHKFYFLFYNEKKKLKPDLVSGFSSAPYRYPTPYRIHALKQQGKEPELVAVFRNFSFLYRKKLTVGPVPVPTFLFSRFGSAFVSISLFCGYAQILWLCQPTSAGWCVQVLSLVRPGVICEAS
jgi:hypothetical protein